MGLNKVPFIKLPGIDSISERLAQIFPKGTENRNYVVRDMAARTVFVMLYANAVEGQERWIRPSHIYFMTDEQSHKLDALDREQWFTSSLKSRYRPEGSRWYADTTREPLRDETLRSGFIIYGAVIEREGIPTTSSKPKYALEHGFTQLFNPKLKDNELSVAIDKWRNTHLSKAALVRQHLVKQGATAAGKNAISVVFPNGETRTLAPGQSSVISKAVIEEFAPRFLKKPAVLWLSESGNKVVARDEVLANYLDLKIDPSKALPDIILVDLGEDKEVTDVLVIFAEVVATDGPVNRERKSVLTQLAVDAGFSKKDIAFLTAYMDRSSSAFKKSISELAWGSYAWFASEPDYIIDLRDGNPKKLSDLIK
ncbi:BsuBI/PstI family type II restriction endonuclease [Aeromonas caviae]|uniref:BsuBI/PstI family type II restriction endonuclease n=1 Tax=Aeromonas caviae TaxID=648 RepID=UPI002B470F52|nr:BsuBI/PstI family type II restriction endonuclease [Aeromonas caviae]